MAGADNQYVTFGVGDEVFAAPVALVREILDYAPPFKIPHGPEHLLGLTDLRGQPIPTVDLRTRLGLPRAEPTDHTRILVMDVPTARGALTLGLVTDRVFEVTPFEADRIEPAPEIGVRWRSDYIAGVVRRERGFVVLVDIARLFTSDEVASIGAGAALGDAA